MSVHYDGCGIGRYWARGHENMANDFANSANPQRASRAADPTFRRYCDEQGYEMSLEPPISSTTGDPTTAPVDD